MSEWIWGILISTLRLTVPLLFAALGGMLSERSGVINIALEGFMLLGAFAAGAVAVLTHSPWMGWWAGGLAGIAGALFYAYFVIVWRTHQIVAGTALNLLALGLTPFLCNIIFASTASTPSLALEDRFLSAPLWMGWIAFILISLWWRYSNSANWVRFAGEHPEALETAGISVLKTRWVCVAMSGFFAGLGGACLSIFLSSSFSRNMTSGRGFMALAAMILGNWKPLPTMLACLLFGLTDALQIQLQGVTLWGSDPVPVQFIQIFPYVVTLLVLMGLVRGSRAPKELGNPWSS